MALNKVQQVLQLALVVGIKKFWVADQDEGDSRLAASGQDTVFLEP